MKQNTRILHTEYSLSVDNEKTPIYALITRAVHGFFRHCLIASLRLRTSVCSTDEFEQIVLCLILDLIAVLAIQIDPWDILQQIKNE